MYHELKMIVILKKLFNYPLFLEYKNLKKIVLIELFLFVLIFVC